MPICEERLLDQAGTRGIGGLQRSRAGKLRALPSERGRRGRISAIHGFRLCGDRASRATRRFPPTRTLATSIWGCAGRCAPILRISREYCGLFRTPSLRNVAVRRVFFHNGVFHRLEDAVRFYAERDTEPQKWYPRGPDGSVSKFDDLPAKYRRNVDTDPPLRSAYGRPPGDERGRHRGYRRVLEYPDRRIRQNRALSVSP